MEVIDLKKHRSYVPQYVELRNLHRDVLLTREVSVQETLAWLNRADVEIRCLVDHGAIAGAVLLYADKGGEVTIFVKEPRKGVGSRLLNLIEPVAHARNIHTIWAWVLASNTAAQTTFHKNGYTIRHRSTKKCGPSEHHGIVFQKTIPQEIVHEQ